MLFSNSNEYTYLSIDVVLMMFIILVNRIRRIGRILVIVLIE